MDGWMDTWKHGCVGGWFGFGWVGEWMDWMVSVGG